MDIKQTKTMVLKVADLHPNDGQLEAIGVHANPRIITDEEYRKLVKSLREDNLTGVLQEKVINYNGEWIVLDGNMRLRALREVGIEEVQCLVVPEDADAKTIEKIIILSNSTFGQWDMDALANWNAPLADWGVELPENFNEEPPSDLDGEQKNKPFAAKLVFVSEKDCQRFIADYKNTLESEYDCTISISGGEL